MDDKKSSGHKSKQKKKGGLMTGKVTRREGEHEKGQIAISEVKGGASLR